MNVVSKVENEAANSNKFKSKNRLVDVTHAGGMRAVGIIEGSEDGTVKQEQKETKKELYSCDEGGHAAVDVTNDPEGELAPQTREQRPKSFINVVRAGIRAVGVTGQEKDKRRWKRLMCL